MTAPTYTAAQRAAAVQRVVDGETRTAVAKSVGCSMSSLVLWLAKAQVPAGAPGKVIPAGARERALGLLDQGANPAQVAALVGVADTSVRRWREAAEGDDVDEVAVDRALATGFVGNLTTAERRVYLERRQGA